MRTLLTQVDIWAIVDLDGSLRTDSQYVLKYRDMAMQPELEKAVEDICNEAIVYDEQRYPVEIVLDHVNLPDNVKDSIRKSSILAETS